MTLADAIIYRDFASVERLVYNGADVNEIDEYGYTPLIEGAIMNKPDVAKLLLDHGAYINEPDQLGGTALHWACDNNNLEFCEMLLEKGANPNAYNVSGQTPLVLPLLRGQKELKQLLYRYKADLNFAQDYINAKLIGHRFELKGDADIVDSKKNFISLDFEGFLLEVTLSIVQDSLDRFRRNYAARHLRKLFPKIKNIIKAYAIASELIKYQQYMVDLAQHEDKINCLLEAKTLIIPIAHQGHAITYVKYGNILARCDRGEESRHSHSVVVYRITNKAAMNKNFIKQLIYKKNDPYFMKEGIKQHLGLEPITQLSIASQVTGNCSWANVEAALPTLLFLCLMDEASKEKVTDIIRCKAVALDFFEQWKDWDKDRALEDCFYHFYHAIPQRQASITGILVNVLVQSCRYGKSSDLQRARKILDILTLPDYSYFLKNYIKVFAVDNDTILADNLKRLLETCEEDFAVDLSDFRWE